MTKQMPREVVDWFRGLAFDITENGGDTAVLSIESEHYVLDIEITMSVKKKEQE